MDNVKDIKGNAFPNKLETVDTILKAMGFSGNGKGGAIEKVDREMTITVNVTDTQLKDLDKTLKQYGLGISSSKNVGDKIVSIGVKMDTAQFKKSAQELETIKARVQKEANNNGRSKYLTSQQNALGELTRAWETYQKAVQNGGSEKSISEKANTVTRWANAYKATTSSVEEYQTNIQGAIKSAQEFNNVVNATNSDKKATWKGKFGEESFRKSFEDIQALIHNGVNFDDLAIPKTFLDQLNSIKAEAKGTAAAINEIGNEGQGGTSATSKQIETLISLFKKLNGEIEKISIGLGTVDDENGLKNMITSISEMTANINNLKNAVNSLKGGLSIDMGSVFDNIGGSKQDKEAEIYLDKVYNKLIEKYNKLYSLFDGKGGDPLLGLWSNSDVLMNMSNGSYDTFYKMYSKESIANLSNMSDKIRTLLELMNLMKQVGASFSKEDGAMGEITGIFRKNDISNFSTVQAKLREIYDLKRGSEKKPEDIFGIGKLTKTLNDASKSLDGILVKLGEIKELMSGGINLNQTIEQVTVARGAVEQMATTAQQANEQVTSAVMQATQSQAQAQQATRSEITKTEKAYQSLDSVIDKQVNGLMEQYGVKGKKAFEEIRSALTDYMKNPTRQEEPLDLGGIIIDGDVVSNVDKVSQAIANNAKEVRTDAKAYADLAEYIRATNSSGSKIYIDDATSQEVDFARNRSMLGKAFTSDPKYKNTGMNFESFITELNSSLGNTIDLSHGASGALEDLVNKLKVGRNTSFMSGEELFSTGFFNKDEMASAIDNTIKLINEQKETMSTVKQETQNSSSTFIKEEQAKQEELKKTLLTAEQVEKELSKMYAISQKGLIGKDSVSVLAKTGEAQTQRYNYNLVQDEDTGDWGYEKSVERADTAFQKLSKTIMKTDEDVAKLKRNLADNQKQFGGSYNSAPLEKLIELKGKYLTQLEQEKNLYAQTDEYAAQALQFDKERAQHKAEYTANLDSKEAKSYAQEQEKAARKQEANINAQKKAVSKLKQTYSSMNTELQNNANSRNPLSSEHLKEAEKRIANIKTLIDQLGNGNGLDIDKQSNVNELITKHKDAVKWARLEDNVSSGAFDSTEINARYEASQSKLDRLKTQMSSLKDPSEKLKNSIKTIEDELNKLGSDRSAGGIKDVNNQFKIAGEEISALVAKERQLNSENNKVDKSKKFGQLLGNTTQDFEKLKTDLKDAGLLTSELEKKFVSLSTSLGSVSNKTQLDTWNLESKGLRTEANSLLKNKKKEVSEIENAYKQLSRTEEQYQRLQAKSDSGVATSTNLKKLEELIAKRKQYNDLVAKTESASGFNVGNLSEKEQKAYATYQGKKAEGQNAYSSNYVTELSKAYDYVIKNEEKYQSLLAKRQYGTSTSAENATLDVMNKEREDAIATIERETSAKEQQAIATNQEVQYSQLEIAKQEQCNASLAQGEAVRDQTVASIVAQTAAVQGSISSAKEAEEAFLKFARAEGQVGTWTKEVKDGVTTFNAELKKSAGETVGLTAKYSSFGQNMTYSFGKAKTELTGMARFVDSVEKKFVSLSEYFVALYLNPMMLASNIKSLIGEVSDFEDALTQISYTMDVSNKQLSDMGKNAIETAKDMGTSVDNMMDILKVYSNMETTTDEMLKQATPTAILANLSGEDASTATDQLQGIIREFNLTEQAAEDGGMHIVDVMDYVSSNIALDFSKGVQVISEASSTAGLIAQYSGMTFEEYSATMGKAAEITRQSGSELGNAFKMIATRISQAKDLSDQEIDTETLSNASKSLHDIGIEVYDSQGNFNSLTDTLQQLANKWDGLTAAQQSKKYKYYSYVQKCA